MSTDWMLQTRETRRRFASATWIPLRASLEDMRGKATSIGYKSEAFACGAVAFPPQHRDKAERLGWNEIGIGHSARPLAYEDGYYSPVEQYQHNDKEPIGIELVFEHEQPVLGRTLWVLNPDLPIALRLVKEGHNWVRPEEDFTVVVRETFGDDGSHTQIEIKREFLLDYLAARGLSLRLSYYRQRVENVASVDASDYAALATGTEDRDDGRFELRIHSLNDVFGASWTSLRVWRNDVDPEDDAPVMGPENSHNTGFERIEGRRGEYEGTRIESEYWRNEWIDSQGISVRVRGDVDQSRPHFIVETDGTRMPSTDLCDEDIGRWLWFRTGVVNDLIGRRGFVLRWYTSETGAIVSTSGYATHFGINSADLITVYAYDVAKLPAWEQNVWAAHNVVPEGKVAAELLESQVKAKPASTKAPEEKLLKCMEMLELGFQRKLGVPLFSHRIEETETLRQISRFASRDVPTLLRLAKELVRVFSDRLDIRELRKLSTHPDKEKLGSNKLLQDVLAQKTGEAEARRIMAVIAGVYDMRVGDAHPTSSKIADAFKLAEIDDRKSFMRQGEQLIDNFARAIWLVGKSLFG